MKKIWIGIGLGLLVVIFVGVSIWKNTSVTNITVETTTLDKEMMEETVMTPGTLKINEEQYVYHDQSKGKIAEIFVEEGDTVKKGDELLRYENESLKLEQEQNDLQIEALNLEIASIKKKHDKIDKELDKDKKNELLQQEHDDIKLQQQTQNIELKRVKLQQESLERELKELIVKADFDGTVLSVDEHASTQDQLNEKSIIHIGSLDTMIVKGSVSQFDTLKIKTEQKVNLSSEAAPDEEWIGEVIFISDLPEESSGAEDGGGVLYPIEVKVIDDIDIKPGFSMVMDIVIREEEVNAIPLNAVQQKDNEDFVYIVENGTAKRVDVKIGIVSNDMMEIKEGISKEDKVILNPTDEIFDGVEVSVE